MAEADSLLRKVNRLLPPRLSYAIRKSVDHKSVRRFESFSEYNKAKHPIDESKEYSNFARQCIEDGDPERLIAEAAAFPPAAWLRPHVRKNVFIALLTMGHLSEARSLLRETLAIGAFNADSLTRMLGDAYLLGDDVLVEQCAKALMGAASKLTQQQQIYVLNTVLLSLGEDALLRVGHLTKARSGPDLNFFLSNLRFYRGDYSAQVDEINNALSAFDLSRVSAIDANRPLSVTNVKAEGASAACLDGPLASILMSTFNASDTLIPVLESLSAQSYKNIEILVVDDCSDDHTVSLAQRYAAEADPRVRVFKMDRNGGTYRARNRGLIEARGEFFTCNDSDDWAHPRKIELLVAPLLANEGLVGTHSQLIRIGKELGIKPKMRGYVHDDMSSLCYRRRAVVDRLGYYETAPFGADSEFTARIVAAFGESALEVVSKPLLLSDWSEKTLSGSLETGITRGGTMAKKRLDYRATYLRRHQEGRLRVELTA